MEELRQPEVETTSLNNVVISGYRTDYVFQCIAQSHDYYEAETLRKWTPWLRDPKYIVDVGANLGNHTLYWATHLQAKKIISIEPVPPNYAMLEKNIQNNHLDCVISVRAAIGEHSGMAKVVAFDDSNYGGTTYEYSDQADDAGDTQKVCTLDTVLSEFQIPYVDFVKIDTEGFELSVLNGMKEILKRDRPALWIEVSGNTVADVYDLLSGFGYSLIDIAAANLLFMQKDAMRPIGMDQLLEYGLKSLNKANTYYANYSKSKVQIASLSERLDAEKRNYQTAKGWLDQRGEELQRLRAQKDELLEKARAYQKNYETCKGWLEQRGEELQRLKAREEELREKALACQKDYEACKELLDQRGEELQRLKEQKDELLEKARAYQKNYETCKGWLEQRNETLEQTRAELARWKNAGIEKQLAACIAENDDSVELLARAKKELQRLQAQNAYLKTENANYARKFAKITATWYGRFALRCYRALRKSKWRVMAVIRGFTGKR